MKDTRVSSGSTPYTVAVGLIILTLLIGLVVVLYVPLTALELLLLILAVAAVFAAIYLLIMRPQQPGGSRDQGDGMW